MPPKISKEAEIVKNLLGKTVNKNCKKFECLAEQGHGWEKWFQMELVACLKESGVDEVFVEKGFIYDSRKLNTVERVENEYKTARIDLSFRSENGDPRSYTGIELKLAKRSNGLKEVLKDIIKLRAIKKSDWRFDSLFFVLMCKNQEIFRESKYDKILADLRSIRPSICYRVNFNRTPGFYAIVIYWDSEWAGDLGRVESYNAWCQKVLRAFEGHDSFSGMVTSNRKIKNLRQSFF